MKFYIIVIAILMVVESINTLSSTSTSTSLSSLINSAASNSNNNRNKTLTTIIQDSLTTTTTTPPATTTTEDDLLNDEENLDDEDDDDEQDDDNGDEDDNDLNSSTSTSLVSTSNKDNKNNQPAKVYDILGNQLKLENNRTVIVLQNKARDLGLLTLKAIILGPLIGLTLKAALIRGLLWAVGAYFMHLFFPSLLSTLGLGTGLIGFARSAQGPDYTQMIMRAAIAYLDSTSNISGGGRQ